MSHDMMGTSIREGSYRRMWRVPLAAALGRQCGCSLVSGARDMLIHETSNRHCIQTIVIDHQLGRRRHWRALSFMSRPQWPVPASGTRATVMRPICKDTLKWTLAPSRRHPSNWVPVPPDVRGDQPLGSWEIRLPQVREGWDKRGSASAGPPYCGRFAKRLSTSRIRCVRLPFDMRDASHVDARDK